MTCFEVMWLSSEQRINLSVYVLHLNFKFGEGTLHTSNSSLSFETVNLKNIDCNEVNPDVLKYVHI